MRIFNSLIVPKNLKEETLLNFLTFVLLQNIKKMKGGPFGDIKKISKISLKKPKREEGGGGGGLILSKKVRIFCFENFV